MAFAFPLRRLTIAAGSVAGGLRCWTIHTGEYMKRTTAVLALLGALPLAAHAQQTTLCTSLITDNPTNPYIDGVVAVSETFPVDGSGDYTSAWKAHIDRKYPSKLQRTSQCSAPAADPATAAQGRMNFIQKWEAGFQTDLEPWRPASQGFAGQKAAGNSTNDGADDQTDSGDDASSASSSQSTQSRQAASNAQSSVPNGGTGQRPICATQPFDAPNTAFPQGSARKITNTCREPLSVRICLRIQGKWDCGVNWNVLPGADWSWGSTKVYTGWFWDARLASSGDKLGHPDN